MSDIRIEHMEFRYPGAAAPVLQQIDLQVREGELLAVIGPSGGGKSTLLSLLAGLNRCTAGQITIGKKKPWESGIRRAMVFQRPALFPWMTAQRNITFAIRQTRPQTPKKEAERQARIFLELVGLGQEGRSYPNHMSGGMQQRVALACALATDAELLLFDEPFASLDHKNRLELQQLLAGLLRGSGSGPAVSPAADPLGQPAGLPGAGGQGPGGLPETALGGIAAPGPCRPKTAVFVTHDLDEALFLADRIAFLAEGKILCCLQVKEPRPRDRVEFLTSPDCCCLRRQLIRLFYGPAGTEKEPGLLQGAESFDPSFQNQGPAGGTGPKGGGCLGFFC